MDLPKLCVVVAILPGSSRVIFYLCRESPENERTVIALYGNLASNHGIPLIRRVIWCCLSLVNIDVDVVSGYCWLCSFFMHNLHEICELITCWTPPVLTSMSAQLLPLNFVRKILNVLCFAPLPLPKKNVFVYVYAVEPHIKPVRTKRDAYYSGKFTMVGDTPKTCFCNQNCEETSWYVYYSTHVLDTCRCIE